VLISNSSKQIHIITIFSIVTILLVFTISIMSLYYINTLHTITENIYHHPLKVSNAALEVQKDILKIHRDMKDVVLSSSAKELTYFTKQVDKEEKNVYKNLEVIKQNILGRKGLELYQHTYQLFKQWKSIRDHVIYLMKIKKIKAAIAITKNQGALHVRHLEDSTKVLKQYAQKKADGFQKKAHNTFIKFRQVDLILLFITLIFFTFFTLYVRRKIQHYVHSLLQNREQIKELNEQFKLAIEGTNDGLWDWNVKEGSIYFSPRWKEMLGYKDDELANEFDTWQSRVHPDDLDYALKKIEQAHNDPSIEYNIIHRLRHKDGSWVWIWDRGKTIFDENNKPVRMVGFHTDITKQKLLEEKILNLKQQFEQFMEYMPANIIIKEDDKIIYANSAATQFFNLNNITGKTADELFSQKSLEKIKTIEEKTYKNGFHEEILEIVNNNNEKKVFRSMSFVMYNNNNNTKLGIAAIDITNEYHANREVSRVLSAFERSNISVVMTDLAGTIEYVNASWCKITGYSKEELIGQNPRIVKSGYISDETYQKMWDELTNGRIWNSEIKNRAKDGSEFWEDSTIMPSFDNEGNIDGYISFKLEISDKIHLRQELKDREEIMIAQSRHAAMGEMISMIAHQWRQPISVIAMDANNILVDIELESIEVDSLKTDLIDIVDQTKYLSKTIDDFRNFFKPTKLKDEVLVSDVFNESFLVISKSLQNHNIDVQNHFNTGTKVFIYSRELLQVFINILKNAKEALIEERTDSRKIVNKIYEQENNIIILICDNAGGIDQEIINKIFDPYFTTKDEINGTGLGLYMSKTIIEKHFNGTIVAQNAEEGTCFKIKFPIDTKGD